MNEFWTAIIEPHLLLARPKITILVGGGDGVLARRLIDRSGEWDGVLHVIDPAPAFDAAALRSHGLDRVVMHVAAGADALDVLPPADLLLLDTDPNWYSVQLALSAAAAKSVQFGRDFPITFLTNVAWPYARRDCYDRPQSIPDSFRLAHEQAGLRPGQASLCAGDGVFAGRFHAVNDHGPRNGVLTALEDFVAGEAHRISYVVLPFRNGIGLLHASAEYGSAAVQAARAMMEMGPAARALAEQSECERLTLAADIGALQRALASETYRNNLLNDALRPPQQNQAPPRGAGATQSAKADAPLAWLSRGRAAITRKARLAVWAARGQLAARRAEEQRLRNEQSDINRLRESPVFDAQWYLQTYPDVAASGAEPASHFFHHGASEHRDPGPHFSTDFYLARYTDIADAGLNPLLHYLQEGGREGRDPSPFFSSRAYLDARTDVAEAGHNPLEHYLLHGRAEARENLQPAQ